MFNLTFKLFALKCLVDKNCISKVQTNISLLKAVSDVCGMFYGFYLR